MNNFYRLYLGAALIFITFLACLSIVTAFLGAEKAHDIFNSIPLKVYWLAFLLLLIASLVIFPRLIRSPGMFLMHAGCVLILFGAMWGSKAGHRLQEKILGIKKFPYGYMVIYEKTKENRMLSEGEKELGRLPFTIYLKNFRVEYYREDGFLQVETQSGKTWNVPARVGMEFNLNDGKLRAKITRIFENLKLDDRDGRKVIIDAPKSGFSPAIKVEIEGEDGTKRKKYVLERFPQLSSDDDGLKYTYTSERIRGVKDYFSDLVVLEEEKEVAGKEIEVNHPLHYGGYHFYQYSYDEKAGEYTILLVVSDTGLNMVFTGYLMLIIGVFWYLWLSHIRAFFKKRGVNGY